MVMMAMDGTFDGWLAPQVLHKIAAENYYCWAFDINQLELLHPLNRAVKPNDDVTRKPVNHLNGLATLLTLKMRMIFCGV